MKLKKDMYVRYTRGMINGYVPPRIAKIVDCSDNDLVAISNSQVILKSDVIKASDDLIELIEVGDYVNGKEVTEVMTDNKGKITDIAYTEETEGQSYSLLPVKNIVTKEQFESMKYIVESE